MTFSGAAFICGAAGTTDATRNQGHCTHRNETVSANCDGYESRPGHCGDELLYSTDTPYRPFPRRFDALRGSVDAFIVAWNACGAVSLKRTKDPSKRV